MATEGGTKTMDPDIKRKLLEELRAGKAARAAKRSPEQYAREAAAKVRREMLQRGLDDAEQRGDEAKAAKYQEVITNLPPCAGFHVTDDGDRLVLRAGD